MNEYPNLKIDIRSHTDSSANDKYNITLSQKRNAATKQYLIDKGIIASRLVGKGYGETDLKNACGDNINCSEEIHQLNRQSGFIIVEK